MIFHKSYTKAKKICKITGLSGSALVSFDSAFVFILLTTSCDDCSGGVVIVVGATAVETEGLPLPRDGQSPTFEKSLAYSVTMRNFFILNNCQCSFQSQKNYYRIDSIQFQIN